MSDIAIKVEGLGKKYTIQHEQGGRYKTLRDTMASTARTVLNRIKHPLTPYDRETAEEFWALKDVSFDIKQGDRVGIIGRNGAGKSTLLKVLSRITEPSTGKITINGRVASLLEVGTGFHPELSGRENIYLNGAILGMKRSEIKRKFDEIVDFAEVEKFLDTPVKRYSSGMYVRLAFAVAAHLEPEILVVDEVLAVGDAQFQKKCLGKMEDVSKNEGRTVLFVSHNIGAIQKLCRAGIFLDRGTVRTLGPIEDVLKGYRILDSDTDDWKPHASVGRYVQHIKLVDVDGNACREYAFGSSFKLVIGFFDKEGLIQAVGFNIVNQDGVRVASYGSLYQSSDLLRSYAGKRSIEMEIKDCSLLPGIYSISIGLMDAAETPYESIQNAVSFRVVPHDLFGTGKMYLEPHGITCLKVDCTEVQNDNAL